MLITFAPWSAAQRMPSRDARCGAAAVRVQHLDRHDQAGPAHTGDALAVVSACGDHPGHHRAVAVLVGGASGGVGEIGAGHEGALQVGLCGIDAAVDDCDDDLPGCTGHERPGRGRLDLAEAPLLRPTGVVGKDRRCSGRLRHGEPPALTAARGATAPDGLRHGAEAAGCVAPTGASGAVSGGAHEASRVRSSSPGRMSGPWSARLSRWALAWSRHRDHGEADDRSNGGTAAHLGSIGSLAPALSPLGA